MLAFYGTFISMNELIFYSYYYFTKFYFSDYTVKTDKYYYQTLFLITFFLGLQLVNVVKMMSSLSDPFAKSLI